MRVIRFAILALLGLSSGSKAIDTATRIWVSTNFVTLRQLDEKMGNANSANRTWIMGLGYVNQAQILAWMSSLANANYTDSTVFITLSALKDDTTRLHNQIILKCNASDTGRFLHGNDTLRFLHGSDTLALDARLKLKADTSDAATRTWGNATFLKNADSVDAAKRAWVTGLDYAPKATVGPKIDSIRAHTLFDPKIDSVRAHTLFGPKIDSSRALTLLGAKRDSADAATRTWGNATFLKNADSVDAAKRAWVTGQGYLISEIGDISSVGVTAPITGGGTSGAVTMGWDSVALGYIKSLDALKAPLISPSFTTPTLGAATATSVNKVTITPPASSATLTIVAGGSLVTAGAFSITLTSTAATSVTLPTTGTIQACTKSVTPATTGTMTITMSPDISVWTITPTGACTFNAAGTALAGQRITFVVTTSGTGSFNLTFGTAFKSIGVLATGTVTAKTFTVNFVCNGTNWCEMSRTVAM